MITVIGEIVVLMMLRKMRKQQSFRYLALSVLVAYLVGVLLITIFLRTYDNETMINTIPLSSYAKMFSPIVDGYKKNGMRGAIDRLKWIDYASRSSIILNILLFVPLGYVVPLNIKKINKWYSILATGVIVSAIIETTQLYTHRGWFDVDDILHNGIGAVLGWLCYRRWLRPTNDIKHYERDYHDNL